MSFPFLAAFARARLLDWTNEVGLERLRLESVVEWPIAGDHHLQAARVEWHVRLVHEGGQQASVI